VNLIVDIGNTLTKTALFDAEGFETEAPVVEFSAGWVDALLQRRPQIERAIVASTRGEEVRRRTVELLRRRIGRVVEFTPEVPVPLGNDYATPRTLGSDRLAAAVAANGLYPGRNVLIVDFGTAVTIDLVTADNTYRGGNIAPGMQMRFRALHDCTASLPLCGACDEPVLLGRSTVEAIQAGVLQGMLFEIEGYIARLQGRCADLCVIFTGGDAKYFAKRIKNTIFADCNLVFRGLNRILEYNASEENPILPGRCGVSPHPGKPFGPDEQH
jgi:type III pantothenate kinase